MMCGVVEVELFTVRILGSADAAVVIPFSLDKMSTAWWKIFFKVSLGILSVDISSSSADIGISGFLLLGVQLDKTESVANSCSLTSLSFFCGGESVALLDKIHEIREN